MVFRVIYLYNNVIIKCFILKKLVVITVYDYLVADASFIILIVTD